MPQILSKSSIYQFLPAATENSASTQESHSGLDPDAVALLRHLDSYPQAREGLIDKSGFSPARVSELLLFLELDGWIEMLPGDKVRKTLLKG